MTWPRWALMWMLAIAIYMTCKWLTWRTARVRHAPVWKHAAYLVAWPGMDATSFLEERTVCGDADSLRSELRAAVATLMAGVVLLFDVARVVPSPDAYIAGWVGMIGAVMILHFGIFHLLSCSWRSLGVQARPLMNRPLASTSLGEFWGRRWNTAFRDLTYQFLYRPCAACCGPRWGILLGFLFSGAVHDLVISVPAQGGYGRPTLFFAIQGAGLIVERSEAGRRIGLGGGWRGRLFAMVALLAPVGLLFHRPFVVDIIVPFMQVLGAI
jgi:hypothetical protein